MDTNVNRVYVNPNFNRVPTLPRTALNAMNMTNYMHVNPNFTRHSTNVHQTPNLNRKIFVNPNFIKSNDVSDKNLRLLSTLETHCNNKTTKVSINANSENLGTSMAIIEYPKSIKNTLPHPSMKSRYCIVRKSNNRLLDNTHQVKETNTIKISKYKSITIHNLRSNLQTVKDVTTNKQKFYCNNASLPVQTLPLHKNVNKNLFKIIRNNEGPAINEPLTLSPRANLQKIKRNIDFSLLIKLKRLNGTNKKNNIPCRLFTKYGKCLRNLSGTCEYLHDKKHVSVCRKFMKGICHDENCLLSHELSSKKMPTCYFYLKGMCTKNNCPYLHVKLSEKSKICLDFLKGYCDKGDKCVQRHIRPHSKQDKKGNKILDNTNKNKCNRSVKVNILELGKSNEYRRLTSNTDRKNVEEEKRGYTCKNGQKKDDVDCRYFREDIQNKDEMCEVLKPSRCKLGTLPSFIQL